MPPKAEKKTELFLSRRQLAERWSCSTETIKRRTRAGILYPVRFNSRMLRYRLADVEAVEQAAGGGAK